MKTNIGQAQALIDSDVGKVARTYILGTDRPNRPSIQHFQFWVMSALGEGTVKPGPQDAETLIKGLLKYMVDTLDVSETEDTSPGEQRKAA